jgi:O-antigen ligase
VTTATWVGRDPRPAAQWAMAGAAVAAVAALGCVAPLWPAILLLAVAYVLAMVRYPEINLIFYYIAGKVGFEERLALGWGLSANQVLQILCIPCLALSVANRADGRTFPRWTLAFLLVLTIVMTVGLLYTGNPEYGTTKMLGYALLVLPGTLFLGLRVRDFAALQKVMWILLATTVVMMLMGLRGISQLQQGTRLAVFGGGAIVYARLMGTGMLLLATVALVLRRAGHRGVAWFVLALLTPGFLVTMYFAGSKGPLIALLISFLVFSFLNRFLRRTLLWIGLIGCVLLVAGMRSRTFQDSMKLVTASRIFIDPRAKLSYGSYNSRLDFWSYSGNLIAHSPVIGVGTGGWGVQRRLFEERIYPHNIFIEVACEYGLGMLALLLSYFGWLAWRARSLVRAPLDRRHAIYASGLVACLVFWFASVQVSGDVIDNRNLWLFAVLVEIAARIAVPRTRVERQELAGGV